MYDREKWKRYYYKHVEKLTKYHVERNKIHPPDPIKRKARRKVQKAVSSGILHKPTKCSECGTITKKTLLHGHHVNYANQLDIEWLCPACHGIRTTLAVPTARTTGPLSFGESMVNFTLVDSFPRSYWWPVVKMSDGTYLKGPYAEIVGRWR
jgi:hypothetical protein